LKRFNSTNASSRIGVAPCVGAWIETSDAYEKNQIEFVAPCVGAWIETSCVLIPFSANLSRALRGRVD